MFPNKNPLEYLRLQLRLEGKEIVNGDRLRQVEVVPEEELPLMILVLLATCEQVAYFDLALSPELYAELNHQARFVEFPTIVSITDVLRCRQVPFETGHYKTYVFPDRYRELAFAEVRTYSGTDARIQAFGFGGFPTDVYGIERDGKVISACVSTLENDFCGEAWVYTDPDFRKQGLAQKVVSTWAGQLMTHGKIPFYSHKIENAVSANLASRLGLQPVFEEIGISYMNV